MNRKVGLGSWIAVGMVFAAVGVVSCGKKEEVAAAPPPPKETAAQKIAVQLGQGYKTGILESPELQWPQGSEANIVLTSSLPIETIDAAPGTRVHQGKAVLTFQARGAPEAEPVTGENTRADRFAVESARLGEDQSVTLAEQNVAAKSKELGEAQQGKGVLSIDKSREALARAEAALGRAKSQTKPAVVSAQTQLNADKPLLNEGEKYAKVSELTAPISGTVVWLKATGGRSAGQPGAVVGQIANTDNVRILAQFDPQKSSAVAPNAGVNVLFAGKPDFTVLGSVVQTQQGAATIKLNDQGHLVRPDSKIVAIGVQTTR